MSPEPIDSDSTQAPLLAADEPAPFLVRNPTATTPVLLVCDHASRLIPRALGTLGLDPPARRCHLALDIGAQQLTESLSDSLEATAVICQYSRLVVDCNRQLMDSGAFLEYGDGVVIPGNRGLSRHERQRRADAIYWPYHRAIQAELQRLGIRESLPLFVSVHSFTPVLDGISRPWEMGILWDKDPDTARCFVEGLTDAGFRVGDNEPYSGKAPQDFTIDHHAEESGIAHVGIEIRQDLICHDKGSAEIAKILHSTIRSALARVRPTDISSKRGSQ